MTMEPKVAARTLPFPLSCLGLHDVMLAHLADQFERHGQVKPTWFVQIPGQLLTIVTDWGSEREKAIHVRAMEQLLVVAKATGYSFACEAWISSYTEAEANDPNRKPPSERDNHEDVAMVTTFMRDNRRMVTRFMVMAANTPRAKLGVRVDEDEAMTGRLYNLFDANRAQTIKEAISKKD